MRTLSASALFLVFAVPVAARAQSYAPPAPAPAPLEDPYYAMPAPPAYQYDPYQGDMHVPPGADGIGYDDAGAEAMAQANAEQAAYVDDGYDGEAYLDFQASLSPYGQWTSVPEYGNVWAPSSAVVGGEFSPYATGGHWALTEYGWTWVSDYDWGWAPFHYGRWVVAGSYGWCWVPGRVWGPAWVSWRYGGGYAGWAPLPPRGVTISPPPIGPGGVRNAWHFTTAANLASPHPTLVTGAAAHAVFNSTSPITNVQTVNRYHVEAGPAPHMIAAATGHALTPTSVRAFAVAAPRSTVVPRVAPAASALHPGAQVMMGPRSSVMSGMSRPLGAPRPMVGGYGSTTLGAGPNSGAFRGPGPGYRAPAYSAPVYQQRPAYGAPAYRAPAYSAPAYRAPAYSPPVYSQPYRAPAYNPPAYHSAPSYSAPSYSAPSYHSAPSYSAPSYHSAPSYSAPSFHSAPSYSAPSYHSAPSYSAPHVGGGGFHFGGRR